MIIRGDCLQEMSKLQDESVDLVVTSPPYAMQRKNTYGGITEDEYPDWFEQIGKEIYRVLKPSGSFVLNIKENSKDGRKSLYVMETVIRLAKIFMWKDTFIWNKKNPFPTGSNRRLKDGFEYCFWFSKGKQYKFYPNNVLIKSESKFLESEKKRSNLGNHNCYNGSGFKMNRRFVSDYIRPSNVITLATDTENHVHPATFPVGLPQFFINLMTETGDVVLDPFMGSGTTGVASGKAGRDFIGIEISEEYCKIAEERIQKETNQISVFEIL